MLALVLQNHPNRAGANLRTIRRCSFRHGSILSRVGASTKPGAVHIYKNRELATKDISNYIETFYNPLRRHSHLAGVSPNEFEASFKPKGKSLH